MHLPQSLCFLGDVYVAKFRSNGFSFRLDIDKRAPTEEKIDAVQKVIGNDLVFQSYPESLRLAHIYSTFTANDVIERDPVSWTLEGSNDGSVYTTLSTQTDVAVTQSRKVQVGPFAVVCCAV